MQFSKNIMVGLNGLEPSTSRLSGVRSNQLSYRPICGGDKGIRTLDPLRARQVLSQLSYLGINCGSRIWTYDLRVMSPTSFQTAPSRDILFLYLISQVKPMIGLEPITCWLQISCSANWATSADCLIGKWVVVDSNHRSNLQQIYSLSPLATRETTHKRMGPTGLEPVTLCL